MLTHSLQCVGSTKSKFASGLPLNVWLINMISLITSLVSFLFFILIWQITNESSHVEKSFKVAFCNFHVQREAEMTACLD